MYQNFIIPYLSEAQHVSGDTPPKLHWQPLVFHTWKVVGHVVGGRCQAHTVPVNRPDHDQKHCYHHAPTVKLEPATAVVVLLMMDVRTPETR